MLNRDICCMFDRIIFGTQARGVYANRTNPHDRGCARNFAAVFCASYVPSLVPDQSERAPTTHGASSQLLDESEHP